jgi:hypothetical protein
MRKVTDEIRLIDGDVLQRLDRLAGIDGQHTIHQEDGVAVRQLLQDLVNVHGVRFSFPAL